MADAHNAIARVPIESGRETTLNRYRLLWLITGAFILIGGIYSVSGMSLPILATVFPIVSILGLTGILGFINAETFEVKAKRIARALAAENSTKVASAEMVRDKLAVSYEDGTIGEIKRDTSGSRLSLKSAYRYSLYKSNFDQEEIVTWDTAFKSARQVTSG